MARKKIREHDAKILLRTHFKRLAARELPIRVAQVDATTDLAALLHASPWLLTTKLVVKPDMLFGQRGKHDLVGLNLDWHGAQKFINDRLGKVVTVKGCTGPVTTFIVEPFVPHEQEYYLCIQSHRQTYEISFSPAGGVDLEDHWDQLQTIKLDYGEPLDSEHVAPLVAPLPLETRQPIESFLISVYHLFIDLDCTMLEMNPFTFDPTGQPFPLDIRMELDDTAKYRSGVKWGDISFPLPFGRTLTSAESYIAELDEQTGASLKFTVLNPNGRVWLMVAGGGASVIYTDTVADLGYAQELGNYGEYSGAPNTGETASYARTVLKCATANTDGRGRALIVGGGIANFTDVAATFTGIISALREHAESIKAANMHIYVRRGGPNFQKGLKLMRDLGVELGLPIQVYGPETSMTSIVAEAIQYVKSFDMAE
mmetsp:Transcript_11426/g.20143  ORF Transcript_11426/g.20143 Transcript_11426/m.20143 type:complete len:428 (+) Transcript_11426:129-1412(+)